jgi:hypothetical protein
MLRTWRAAGVHAAIVKFGLDQVTQPDSSAGDPAWDHVTDVPGDNPKAPILLQDVAKAAALGLKDMVFFENMLGPAEARNMFQGIERQMTGQGSGTHGTWTPQGVIPRPAPRRASSMPPPSPGPLGNQAAAHVISSAPPPIPRR